MLTIHNIFTTIIIPIPTLSSSQPSDQICTPFLITTQLYHPDKLKVETSTREKVVEHDVKGEKEVKEREKENKSDPNTSVLFSQIYTAYPVCYQKYLQLNWLWKIPNTQWSCTTRPLWFNSIITHRFWYLTSLLSSYISINYITQSPSWQ